MTEHIGRLDDAASDGQTTAAEAKELAEEREGLATSARVALENAESAREQMAKTSGGDALVAQLLAVLGEMNSSMRSLQVGTRMDPHPHPDPPP